MIDQQNISAGMKPKRTINNNKTGGEHLFLSNTHRSLATLGTTIYGRNKIGFF